MSFETSSRPLKILLLAGLFLALAGCASSFVYNRLDWLIPWYVDNYVDLSREQRQSLRGHLDPALKWHRGEELARYEALLDGIEQDLSQPVGADDVLRWFRGVMEAAERTEDAMLRVFLDFGDSLSDAQVREFLVGLREQQAELEQELLTRSDEDYVRDGYESLDELLKRFLGRLDATQQERLRVAAGSLRRFDAAWLEERTEWLDRLDALLRERQPGWQQAVQQAFRERREQRTPAYREILAHNLAVSAPAVAEVVNGRSERQSRHLAGEFADLRETLQDLRSEAPQAQPAVGPSP